MRKFLEWIVKNPLPTITIGGLLLYGVVRLAYALFYEPLGVTPEDVGLGYQQTLAQSALAVFLITMLVGIALAVAAATYWVSFFFYYRTAIRMLYRPGQAGGKGMTAKQRIRILEQKELSTESEKEKKALERQIRANRYLDALESRGRSRSPVMLAFSFVVAFVLASILLITRAHDAASSAKRGRPVRGDHIFGVPFLGIRAERADVVALRGAQSAQRLGLTPNHCLLYLGQSSGTTFLYAFEPSSGRGTTLRVPSSEVQVSTSGTRDAC
jgi:hypothetical protein